jgi:enoyl-CoA hydratase/carnithine racemase
MNQPILWEIFDEIGHIILNDPPTNKMDKQFFERLTFLVNEVVPKSNVKALVIYGAGRHFSQGADLEDLLSEIKKNVKTDKNGKIIQYPEFLIENNKSFSYFKKLTIPVIAAIRGVCLGSALELILFCDIRICSDNAIFGFPESTFNLMPGCGGTQNILKLLNYSKALELVLTGKTFDAEEALKLNIVDAVVSRKDVIVKAINIAKQIVNKDNR